MNVQNDHFYSFIDGKVLDINSMTKHQLRDLHYHEESAVAKKILAAPPFSNERKELMNKGYTLVEELIPRYQRDKKSFGASSWSVQKLEEIVRIRAKKTNKEVVIYEAGVGTGYAIKKLADVPGVRYIGCDVALLKEVEKLGEQYNNLILRENTIYEDLHLVQDEVIDVFYADNVIEHMLPDEIDKILSLLYKKMKKGGMLFLVIPNRLSGPFDISRNYQRRGTKANGFHFMEMSYVETIGKFSRNGFRPAFFISCEGKIERDPLYLKNIKRMITESLVSRIKDEGIRLELLKQDRYGCYILTK